MSDPQPLYRARQTGWLTFTAVAVALAFAGSATLAADAQWALSLVIVLSLMLCGVFGWLTVQVDREAVRLQFGLGPVRKTIPIERITAVRVVRNPWYWGWGIRLIPGGWMWNVHGLGAVELQLDGKRVFRVGTAEPQKLAAAIQAALS